MDRRENNTPLTDGQRALAAAYVPLARKLARRLEESYPALRGEATSAVMFSLVQTARSFDPSGRLKFPTALRNRVKWDFTDLIRGHHTREDRVRPDAGFATPDHGEPVSPIGDTAGELDSRDQIEAWLRVLPAKHARICRMVYCDGATQAAVARDLGWWKSDVHRYHKEALDILRDHLSRVA